MKKYDIIQFSDVSPASTLDKVEVSMKKKPQIKNATVKFKYQKPYVHQHEEEVKPIVKKQVDLKNKVMSIKAVASANSFINNVKKETFKRKAHQLMKKKPAPPVEDKPQRQFGMF